MEFEELLPALVNALIFFLVYKIGEIVGHVKATRLRNTTTNSTAKQLEHIKLTGRRPIITVEEINGIFYAYDGNDFLAQAAEPDTLGKLIVDRYANKYATAHIQFKK